VWMDGRLVDFADAKVHVLGHTLHYGVGVFEGIRGYPTKEGAAVFRLREHVSRLLMSAHFYQLALPYTAEQIEQAIVEVQATNAILPSYIRPLVYRGEPALGVKNMTGKVSLAIAAIPAKKYLGPGSENGVRAKISPFRKPHSDAIPSFAKSAGNYINSYLAGVDASKDGYEEAILLDQNGYVAEGTGENVFLVRGGTLYTPGPESDILMGITRDSVIQIARDLGYPVVEKLLTVNELLSADEVFFTGTYAEIAPVKEIGHYPIGERTPGPITRDILETFGRVVRGEEPKYAKWLAPVPALVAPAARTRK
jgi:branched-chain amino acid aminotransferase